MRNRIQAALCMISALFLCLFSLPVHAEKEQQNVRVAVYNDPNYIQMHEDGSVSGYAYEYLTEIQKYADFEYEFIEMTFDEATNALIKGEIDLLAGVQFSEESAALFDYSARSIGEGGTMLCALPGKADISFNDYAAFDGMRIGTLRGSGRIEETQEKLARYGASVSIIEYDTDAEAKAALYNGETDALMMSATRGERGYNMLARITAEPLYFCVSKQRPDIMAALNDALDEIHLASAYYEQALDEKYFGGIEENTALTAKEKNYILAQAPLTVAVFSDSQPVEYYDDEREVFDGITIEIFELISQYTGLSFNYVARSNTAPLNEALADGSLQLIGSCAQPYMSMGNIPIKMSAPFLNETVCFLVSPSMTDYLNQDAKVALRRGTPLYEGIAKEQGYSRFIYFDTQEECIEAVSSGKADLTPVNSMTANRLLNHAYYQFRIHSIPNKSINFSIGVNDAADPLLLSIINKALESISLEQLNTIILRQLSKNYDDYTLRDYWAENSTSLIIFMLVIALLCCGMGIFTILSRSKMNRKLIEAARRAETAGRAKMDFLSRMSHEIRTPMNAVIGMAQLGQKDADDAATVRADLKQIEESSRYLLGLINDILDVSRIENNQLEMHPEWHALSDVIGPIISMMKPLMDGKQIRFVHPDPAAERDGGKIYCYIDKMRIQQVIINLLNNAYKFTPEGGSISWRGKRLTDDGESITEILTISDTGCGMSKEFIRQIGTPFVQERNRFSDSAPGTGLGLYIVKKICEAMSFPMQIESKPMLGTTFSLTLNYPYKIAKPEEAKAKADTTDFSGLHFLLVEDNAINRRIGVRLLSSTGADIKEAENGKEALELFSASPISHYDAILMDIRMPVMDGLTATRSLRALARADAKTVPIIAMSANAFSEDREESLRAGMNEHLSKPIERDELFRAIAFWIKRRKEETMKRSPDDGSSIGEA